MPLAVGTVVVERGYKPQKPGKKFGVEGRCMFPFLWTPIGRAMRWFIFLRVEKDGRKKHVSTTRIYEEYTKHDSEGKTPLSRYIDSALPQARVIYNAIAGNNKSSFEEALGGRLYAMFFDRKGNRRDQESDELPERSKWLMTYEKIALELYDKHRALTKAEIARFGEPSGKYKQIYVETMSTL